MNLFLTLKLKYQQKNTVLNIESLGLSPQRQQSNRLKKNRTKRDNSDVPSFICKVAVLFHIELKNVSLTLCWISEHLQDALLTKLLGQFNEVHKVDFSKD